MSKPSPSIDATFLLGLAGVLAGTTAAILLDIFKLSAPDMLR